MYFFIYALEELYSYHYNDCNWAFTSAFANSKIVLISSIYRNWNGINSVKHTVLAIPNTDTSRQVDTVTQQLNSLECEFRWRSTHIGDSER